MARRKIEIFTAGCAVCDETVALVRRIACPSCDVEVIDMKEAAAAAKARHYGLARVPAVVIDGKLAECCTIGAPNEATLRAAGLGQA